MLEWNRWDFCRISSSSFRRCWIRVSRTREMCKSSRQHALYRDLRWFDESFAVDYRTTLWRWLGDAIETYRLASLLPLDDWSALDRLRRETKDREIEDESDSNEIPTFKSRSWASSRVRSKPSKNGANLKSASLEQTIIGFIFTYLLDWFYQIAVFTSVVNLLYCVMRWWMSSSVVRRLWRCVYATRECATDSQSIRSLTFTCCFSSSTAFNRSRISRSFELTRFGSSRNAWSSLAQRWLMDASNCYK